MSENNNKISIKQSMILFIILFCAPAIRYIPLYSSARAHQAAWLSPFFAFVLLIIYALVWSKFAEKFKEQSFVDIIKNILGNVAGNIVILIYWIWITIFLAYNVRMYVVRIVVSAMPNVSVLLLCGVMLIMISFIVRKGIVNLARMGELFFLILTLIFIIYNVLIIPELDIYNLYPITYKDVGGIIKGSFPILSIFGYNVLILFFNDKITYTSDFKKVATKSVLILSIISLIVIIVSISTFGWKIISTMPVPYLNTMMQISLFDVVERIESGIVMFWILTDFILIAVFTYSSIHIIGKSLKINETRPLISIYLIFIFFLAVILANSSIELQTFSENILTPTNIALGYCLPIIIFIIGKLRKKV